MFALVLFIYYNLCRPPGRQNGISLVSFRAGGIKDLFVSNPSGASEDLCDGSTIQSNLLLRTRRMLGDGRSKKKTRLFCYRGLR